MADSCGFQCLRTLRSSTLGIDNGSRERHALAAFRLTAEAAIGLARARRTIARGFTYLSFPNGITNANDHVAFPPREERYGATATCSQGLLRVIRIMCGWGCPTAAVAAPPFRYPDEGQDPSCLMIGRQRGTMDPESSSG